MRLGRWAGVEPAAGSLVLAALVVSSQLSVRKAQDGLDIISVTLALLTETLILRQGWSHARSDVSEERRSQILDAAVAVFARLGFHQARMDDIVQEAGLSKGALYWYFKSKDEIVMAILSSLFERERA